MKTALLFPGQGSQFVGMGHDLVETFDEARAVFEEADRLLGFPLSRICFEGPEEELKETRNTQPALFVHSIAVLRTLANRHPLEFEAAAGHSLGEYTAYVAAGQLRFEDGLRLVRRRGELMFEAGVQMPGAMAAILGLDGGRVREIVTDVAGIVVPANLNSPGQTVISGEVKAVEEAMKACKEAGAKRVIALVVSGAFHSPLMERAAKGLDQALAGVEIASGSCPVYANASAGPESTPDAIRLSLSRQLLSPVRWEETIRNMREQGIGRFIEVGPGRVLCGLARAIDRSATTMAVGKAEEIESFAPAEAK